MADSLLPDRWEQQLSDLGLVLLEHQLQPQVDGVVDNDGPILARENDTPHTRGGVRARLGWWRQDFLLVDREFYRLRRACLVLDNLGIFIGSWLQTRLDHAHV